MILCCDTSTEYSVYAVARLDGSIIASSAIRHERQLSARIFSEIESVLNAARCDFSNIDVLAVGIGPGSFTGIRIAVATFRTLAQASSKRLIGVGLMDMYAHSLANVGDQTIVIPILYSRRNELYAAAYKNGQPLKEPFAATYSELLDYASRLAESNRVLFTGANSTLPSEFARFPFMTAGMPNIESFAQISAHMSERKTYADPLGLNPLYVVPPAINQHNDAKTMARLIENPSF
jgi:tRNA threonylcarbamoyladenosine biosynthesis protein TsaB